MGRNGDGLVRVGILGCGNVGSALVGLLDANADLITRRSGVRIEVARVAVQHLTKERPVTFAPGVLTNDAERVVDDPSVDVVVEMIGGVEPARSLITARNMAGTSPKPKRPENPATRPSGAIASPCARGWPGSGARSSSAP